MQGKGDSPTINVEKLITVSVTAFNSKFYTNQVQFKICEETRDSTKRDLIEVNRKLREAEEMQDRMRKEIMELKR